MISRLEILENDKKALCHIMKASLNINRKSSIIMNATYVREEVIISCFFLNELAPLLIGAFISAISF